MVSTRVSNTPGFDLDVSDVDWTSYSPDREDLPPRMLIYYHNGKYNVEDL